MNIKVPLCIKLDEGIRDKFKEIAHNRRTTMQSVLNGFVAVYISNPDAFVVKNDTTLIIQEGEN